MFSARKVEDFSRDDRRWSSRSSQSKVNQFRLPEEHFFASDIVR